MSNNKVEEEIRKFLDKNFYNSKDFDSVHRNLIRELDANIVLLTSDKYNIFNELVEERYATKYVNLTVNSFALELTKLDENKVVVPGWFLDNDTEYILFVYIYADVLNWTSIKEANITKVELLLVSKDAILNKLQEFLIYDLFSIADKVRIGDIDNIQTSNLSNEYWFHYNAVTKIVNLVLRKDIYKEICLIHKIIKKEEK